MNIGEHLKRDRLIAYSFLWSEARLVIAAGALFLNGVPPISLIFGLYGFMGTLLTFAWIISGVASGYLLYQWHKEGGQLFGKKELSDRVYFFVLIVSGFNLGFAGLFKTNIGMSISSNYVLFLIVGLLYIFSAYYLFTQWKKNNKKIL
ncbi:MAG: hypothetical protein RJA61_696 [Candidatus Parcubacteria bacterium]|jgi:hypothetical protein